MASDIVWILNTGTKEASYISDSWKKMITFKPGRPKMFPKWEAIHILRSHVFKECHNPNDYFKDGQYTALVIRDQGIGDMIQLEPILRAWKKKEPLKLTVATLFPDIFKNNPAIDNVVKMSGPNDNSFNDPNAYDQIIELRMYSERGDNARWKNRTLIYNEQFGNIKISDADFEPKLFISYDEKNTSFIKKKKNRYIGLQLDASEPRRRYEYGRELIGNILDADPSNVAVIFGNRKYVTARGLDYKRIIDLQGQTDVRQAMLAIKDLDGFIATDSGLMHVALALHVPTVCLFGLIPHALRIKYYTGLKRVIEKKIACIACSMRSGPNCDDKKTIPCLDIPSMQVYNELSSMIDKADNVGTDKARVETETGSVPIGSESFHESTQAHSGGT